MSENRPSTYAMPPSSPGPSRAPPSANSPSSQRRFVQCLAAIWAVVALALVAVSIKSSDGRLVYTLDDPYIHLSLAESILAGGYGVNPGEFAAPSSSILYPLLLVVPTAVGLGEAGPLGVNLLAMLLAVIVVGRWLAGLVLTDELLAGSQHPLVARLAVGLACCAVMNAWGLVMTGMEHSLHVLLSVTVLWRLALASEVRPAGKGGFDPMLVAACVALPLVRFEGLALTLAASVAMLYLRCFGAAAVTLSLTAAALGAWAVIMARLGLPWLPSSVLTKSEFAARVLENKSATALAKSIALNVRASLLDRQGALLCIGALFAAFSATRAFARGKARGLVEEGTTDDAVSRWRTELVSGAVAAGMAVAHVVLGRYGWFSRYEVYAVAYLAFACLYLARAGLALGVARVTAVSALLVVAAPYVQSTVQTPWAARGIYDQQYQMHRFVVEHWRRPIAANDLGWLSYKNPDYVLDLWGLGSEDARRLARRGQLNAAGVAAFVRERGIDLAIVYHRSLFADTPEGWVRVAVLRTSIVTGADTDVGFFATSAGPVEELRGLLKEFAATLSYRSRLELAR